jgi:hypothetical protein
MTFILSKYFKETTKPAEEKDQNRELKSLGKAGKYAIIQCDKPPDFIAGIRNKTRARCPRHKRTKDERAGTITANDTLAA